MDNRSSFPGENNFLRGLYELSEKVSKEFGRDTTEHGRAFNYFIDYILIMLRVI